MTIPLVIPCLTRNLSPNQAWIPAFAPNDNSRQTLLRLRVKMSNDQVEVSEWCLKTKARRQREQDAPFFKMRKFEIAGQARNDEGEGKRNENV